MKEFFNPFISGSDKPDLDGDDIKATGYAKAESKSNITGTDTINQALGKLEYKVDTNETNISTLAKHINGDLLDSDFQEDSTVAMVKTVPEKIMGYAAIKKLCGKNGFIVEAAGKNLCDSKTLYGSSQFTWDNDVLSGLASDIQSVKIPVTENMIDREYTFSAELKIESGAYYISVVFGNSTSSQTGNMVSSSSDFKNSSITVTPTSTSDYFMFTCAPGNKLMYIRNIQLELGSSQTEYEEYHETKRIAPIAVDSIISTSADGTNIATILIPDSIKNLPDYGVEGNVVDFENGTYTHTNKITDGEVTALPNAETINISDMLMPIRVEAGGTITFNNEYNLSMPNTIVYKKEVSLS